MVPVKHIFVEGHKRHQLVPAGKHKGLVNKVDSVEHLLYFLRVDVLSGRTENHVAEPPPDGVSPLCINHGKVVGTKPPVFREGPRCPLRILVVAEHHVGSLCNNLPFSRLGIAHRLQASLSNLAHESCRA